MFDKWSWVGLLTGFLGFIWAILLALKGHEDIVLAMIVGGGSFIVVMKTLIDAKFEKDREPGQEPEATEYV